MARDCKLMTPTKNIVANEFQDKKQKKDWKKREEKGRKGEIHDFPMRNRETKSMAYGQRVFKKYDK